MNHFHFEQEWRMRVSKFDGKYIWTLKKDLVILTKAYAAMIVKAVIVGWSFSLPQPPTLRSVSHASLLEMLSQI